MQRGRGHAREAVGAGAFQRPDPECPADSLFVEIVCDLDRDIGDICLIGQLDIARGGDERAVGFVDRGQGLVVDVVNVEEMVKFALAERELWE
jgi:hypothetical protein